jgi:hypothetical protein
MVQCTCGSACGVARAVRLRIRGYGPRGSRMLAWSPGRAVGGGGPPRHRATTSMGGRTGRSAGTRTTRAPTTAHHPAVASPLSGEPRSRPAANLVAVSGLQATRPGPARRQHAGHTGADAGHTPSASQAKRRYQPPGRRCLRVPASSAAARSAEVSWPSGWRGGADRNCPARPAAHRTGFED